MDRAARVSRRRFLSRRNKAKRYLARSREAWAEGVNEPQKFIPAGDQMVVFVHARVRATGSNDWRDDKPADVYTI